jgi:DNA polymerase III epsilon subunit-like protein
MIDMSRPWWQLPVCVIDTETTGVGEDDRIVEIACVRFEDGFPVAKFSTLVYPGRNIPDEATAVHGIKDEDVVDLPRFGHVAGKVFDICKGAVPCAFNSPFDRSMLHREIVGTDFHALNVTAPAFDLDQSWIDPLCIVRSVDKYEKSKKLVDACARRGIVLEGAHRALADSLACGALLWTFKPRLKDISAAELIRLCDVRRAEQEREFNERKARQVALGGESANG